MQRKGGEVDYLGGEKGREKNDKINKKNFFPPMFFLLSSMPYWHLLSPFLIHCQYDQQFSFEPGTETPAWNKTDTWI